MPNHRKMKGKRVLVTGAGTGLGREIGLEFARQGAAVVLHYCHSAAGSESAVEEIQGFGGRAKSIGADFRNVDSLKTLAAGSIEFLGGLDVLINNAGITANRPFEDTTVDHFDTLFNVNIRAMFFLTQAVLPEMEKKKKGVVINLSSVHAFSGLFEYSVYAATKGAILAFTRAVSLELIRKGVRVNAIAPGWVRVENQERALGTDFDWKEAEKTLPAGFVGTPADVAGLAVFLASDEARYIIGQTMVIDGGQLAVMPCLSDSLGPSQVRFGRWYVEGQ